MAIYHLSTKPISRSDGRTATASIAYRVGIEITDERTGKKYDYTNRGGVVETTLHTPNNLKIDRVKLWNLAETTETRKNSRTAREIVVNLPYELKQQCRSDLVNEFAKDLAEKYGVAVDVAIHTPDKEGDDRNHHAHIMLTTRKLERLESGKIALTEKSQLEMSNTQLKERSLPSAKEELKAIRKDWADKTNNFLKERNIPVHIDHRSHKDRGLVLKPTKKLGWEATALERNGVLTKKGNHNRMVKEFNESIKDVLELNRLIKLARIEEKQNEQTKRLNDKVAQQVSTERNPNERKRGLSTASSGKSDKLGQRHTNEVGRTNSTNKRSTLRDRQPQNQEMNKQSEVTAVTEPKTRSTPKKPPVIEGQTVKEALEVTENYNHAVAMIAEQLREKETKPLEDKLKQLATEHKTLKANTSWLGKGKREKQQNEIVKEYGETKRTLEYHKKSDFRMDAKAYIEQEQPQVHAKAEEAHNTLTYHASFKYGMREAQAGRQYTGEITAVNRYGVQQKLPNGKKIYHDLERLNPLPNVGDKVTIKYDSDHRAEITTVDSRQLAKQQQHELEQQQTHKGMER